MNLVRKEERRGPKTWPKGTNRDTIILSSKRSTSVLKSLRDWFPSLISLSIKKAYGRKRQRKELSLGRFRPTFPLSRLSSYQRAVPTAPVYPNMVSMASGGALGSTGPLGSVGSMAFWTPRSRRPRKLRQTNWSSFKR